ncbi:hypothetical protein RDI58_024708 [Solanum bulbocastanum]|uniref:RNase H type-1 domain-containing protein n=1 Tax=Solanum bulbocastanum TaxID=147425 RepID=A0AAN8T0C2_SOLBU
MTEYIVESIKPGMTETLDKAWWMGNSKGEFTVKSTDHLNYKPNLYFHIVKWEAPDEGWVKCNTDGARKGNPGESSYGFCLRNSTGDLLYAEAQCIDITTNIEAEIIAMWNALKYCKRQGINNIILETDSLSLKNMIMRDWKIPWSLTEKIEEIQKIMANMHIQVMHIFREANELADCIANLAIIQEEKQHYDSFHSLPSRVRR